MPRVLLLLPTTTYRSKAFLTAAQRMGVEVTVGSEKPNALARMNPTAFLTLSFHDPQRAARQVADFAAEHPIDAVVPVDDQVTVVAAAVCRELSLRHHSVESAQAARDKYRMRQLFERAGVPSPGFRLCRLADDAEVIAGELNYPCVVKPLGLSGSQGVIRADNEPEFIRAVGRLAKILHFEGAKAKGSLRRKGHDSLPEEDQWPSMTSHFLVEDFVAGPEVALEGLLSRGKLRMLALFDKPDPLDGPFFEETIYVTPSRLPVAVSEKIVRCTGQAAEALGLSEGPIHAELRLGSDGPCVIEVNARSIGGQCSGVLQFGTGNSLEELIIAHALDGGYEPPVRERRPAGVMMIPIHRAGKLSAVHGLDEAENVVGIEQVAISAHVGQELVPLPEGAGYLGFLFAKAASTEAVEAALREAHGRLDFVIESGDSQTQPANTTSVQARSEP